MPKFKVLETFVLNGIEQKINHVVEIDNNRAGLSSIQTFIEKVSEDTPLTGVKVEDKSVLSSIKPGEQLTPEQKEKLAKENVAETTEAHRLATEQRTKDIAEGRGEPAVKAVADALKDKLVNKEFKQPEGLPESEFPSEEDFNKLP